MGIIIYYYNAEQGFFSYDSNDEFAQFTWSSTTGNNVITLEWWDAEGSIQVDPGFQLECRQFA